MAAPVPGPVPGVQLTTNVMIFRDPNTGHQFILASEDTPYVRFVKRGEKMLELEGQIVRDFVVPAQQPMGASSLQQGVASDDDDDARVLGDIASVAMSVASAVMSSGSDGDGGGGGDSVELESREQQRPLPMRAEDTVVSNGDSATDGSTAGGRPSTTRRRGGSPSERGDRSTYVVADGGEGSASAAAAAAAASPGPLRPRGPAAAPAASVMIDMPTQDPTSVPIKIIEDISTWYAYRIFSANYEEDASVLVALRRGKLQMPTAIEKVVPCVDAWREGLSGPLFNLSVAKDLLLTTLRQQRANLSDPNVQHKISGLLDAIDTFERQLPFAQ